MNPKLILSLLMILTVSTGAIAQDWSQENAGHPDDPAPKDRPALLAELVPGDQVAWLLVDGELGHGTVAAVVDSSLVTDGGVVVDTATCQAIWIPLRSRSDAFARGLGYGMAVGAIAATAIYAGTYNEADSGFLSNLGSGLGMAAVISGGLIVGLISGVAGPVRENWTLVHSTPGADTARADFLPHPDGRKRRIWAPGPWLDVTPALTGVGWRKPDGTHSQFALRTALWWPLGSRVSLGTAVTVSEESRVPGSSRYSGALLMRLGPRVGTVQPYLNFGLGLYGPLGGSAGVSFTGGLRTLIGNGWAWALEAGSAVSLQQVDGDKPGTIMFGVGISRSFGGNGSSH